MERVTHRLDAIQTLVLPFGVCRTRSIPSVSSDYLPKDFSACYVTITIMMRIARQITSRKATFIYERRILIPALFFSRGALLLGRYFCLRVVLALIYSCLSTFYTAIDSKSNECFFKSGDPLRYAKKKTHTRIRFFRSAKLDGKHTHTHTFPMHLLYIFCTVFFILKKITSHPPGVARVKGTRETESKATYFFLFFFVVYSEKIKVARTISNVFFLLLRIPGRRHAAFFREIPGPLIYHVKRQTRRWRRA